jgi:two-component system sensor histidine kinase AlgZ
MHPLLTRINRFGLYLLGWIPLTGALIYFLARPGGLGWRGASAVALPLCVIYQFVCLSAWYPCKGLPLATSSIQRILATHVTAAAVVSILWAQLGRGLAYLLSRLEAFRGLDERYASQIPAMFGAGFLFYLLAVAFHYVILAMQDSREAQERAMQTTILARDAELKALKAQVNPHFLFNSLNSISALTTSNPQKAKEMCILLSEFLRMTLGLGEKDLIPFSDEMALLHRFVAIEKVRFGSRFQIEEEIADDCAGVLIPPLLLQPLLENAVTHGIANLLEGGAIRLAAHRRDGQLYVSIENSFDPEATPQRRSGLGLQNVRRRLETRYRESAAMHVTADEGRFRVDLSMPAQVREVES